MSTAAGTVAAGGLAAIRGWAVDASSRRPVDAVRVAIGDGEPVHAILGFSRDVVAERLSSPAARASGFVAAVPVDAVYGSRNVRVDALVGERWTTVHDAERIEVVPAHDPFEALRERGEGWLFGVDAVTASDGAAVPRDGETWILERGAIGRIRMWALDLLAWRPAGRVVALIGGSYCAAVPGFDTPLLADTTGVAGAERAGFAIPVLAPLVGAETVRLFAISPGGDVYGELGTVRVSLREPLALDAVPNGGAALGGLDRAKAGGAVVDHTGPIAVQRGTRIVLDGWAVDRYGPRLAAQVELDVAGAGRFEAEYGFRREDVASTLQCNVAACGFSVSVDTAGMEPGVYRASLRVLSARRDAFAEIQDVDLVVH